MDNDHSRGFWADLTPLIQSIKPLEKITPTFMLDDYLQMIEGLDKAGEQLHKTYIQQYIHLQRIKNELGKHLDYGLDTNESINNESIHSSMLTKDVLLIQLDHLLPMINDENLREKRYFNELRNYYVPALTKSIDQVKANFKYDKVFVSIVQYYPIKIVRDIDNHFIKFIFNSLRYSGVVPDDSFENIFFMMLGTLASDKSSDTGYTEIYITDHKKMNQVINLLPL